MRFENPMDCSKAEEFDVLPAGTYDVQIAKIESKPTQRGGMYFSIQLVIVNHPQFTKRSVFDNVNFVNANPQAEAIGRNRLASIGKSCGLMTLSDTDELIGRVLQADVIIEDDDHYGKTNRIKRYHASTAAPITIGVPPQTQAPAQGFPQASAPAQGSVQNYPPQRAYGQPQAQAPMNNAPWNTLPQNESVQQNLGLYVPSAWT